MVCFFLGFFRKNRIYHTVDVFRALVLFYILSLYSLTLKKRITLIFPIIIPHIYKVRKMNVFILE